MTPQELFSRVSKPKIERSTFDRSHGFKTSFDAGKLIPIYCDEALPGDTFNMKATLFGRIATPLKPIMDNIAMDVHFFSVPYRLLWDNFEKFMGAQDNPGDSTSFVLPTMVAPASPGVDESETADYLGIPTKIPSIEFQSLPFRAINFIYNEWYRDENLQTSVTVDTDDGPDTYADYSTILPRGKRKDYFTSCLPWPQKGSDVTLPLGNLAPVVGLGVATGHYGTTGVSVIETGGGTPTYAYAKNVDAASANTQLFVEGDISPSGDPQIFADLSNATAATINQLREAFQLQKLYERDARGGTRYIEMNYAHFGVMSPDARLQRPEYLGGGTSHLNINPIAQQGETGTTPQGNLAAMGTFTTAGNGFIKTFTEHEIVLGFISARADLNYQQGLNRMWSRSTRFDHYFPALAHLGEQSVLNKEIWMDGSANDDLVFGYAERFAEYRFKPSLITGRFRSNATTSLDLWHLAQDFATLPGLDATFIEETPPMSRIVAVTSEPDFLLDCYFDLKCTRPMPTFSIPGKIDHF